MLETFLDSCTDYKRDLDQLLTLFVVLVGYDGFLRISELLQLQVGHITVNHDDHMSLFLPKRKNDQFRKEQSVCIARTNKRTSPVVGLRLQKFGDKPDSPYPLVRRIQHTKAGKLFHPTLGVSSSRIRDVIKSKCGRFFDDPRQLGTHSLRSGGISDPGCQSLEMLQRHGGWKTVASKNKYIQPSNATLPKVSLSLTI